MQAFLFVALAVGLASGPAAAVVAGDPAGTPSDSPANRVDPNVTTSPFAGVVSLEIFSGGTFICSGVLISPLHVLTSGHCVDLDNDGVVDVNPSNVTCKLNFGSNLSHTIPADQIQIHPDFTGFLTPVVNDDLSILTLSAPVPAGVPIYAVRTTPISPGTAVTLVGYGASGDPINGYTVSPSFSVKRVGQNAADSFDGQDDAGGAPGDEVFEFDHDGPDGNGASGGPSLGNDVETTLGGGDNGGPAFVFEGGEYVLVGINTFTAGGGFPSPSSPPEYGSLGGGVLLAPYADWIDSVTSPPAPIPAVGPPGLLSLAAFLLLVGSAMGSRRAGALRRG